MAESKGVVTSQPRSKSDTNELIAESSLQTMKTRDSFDNETSEKTDVFSFPGEAVLQQLDNVEVVQHLDVMEVCLGFTRSNRYNIYNEEGKQIFYVYEAAVCFNRQLLGALRPLELKVSLCDENQENALLLNHPGRCSSRCCWICCNLQRMEVQAPTRDGPQLLATMEEVWSCCIPHYRVTDSQGETMWQVKGGACHCRCCCCQLKFQFVNRDGQAVASITRSCQGSKEIIGAANRFTIHFSDCLTPQEKLIVLGGSFLVDLNYFEKQHKCW